MTVAPSDVALVCDPASCAVALNNAVIVSVTGHFRLLTPLLSTFFGGQDLTFHATSRAQLEVLPTPAPPPTPTTTLEATPSPSPTPTPSPTPLPACGLPSAGFTYTRTPVSNQAPVTVTVTDTSTSPGACSITSWVWNWGDGTGHTSNGQVPGLHTYSATGQPGETKVYQLTLTVSNSTGSNTSGAASISVTR